MFLTVRVTHPVSGETREFLINNDPETRWLLWAGCTAGWRVEVL